MFSGIKNSIAALQALGQRQAVSANNLANATSDNYQTTTAHLKEGPTGDPALQLGKDSSPGLPMSEADGTTRQSSNVDITRELSSMIPTRTAYSANLKTLQVADEMSGTLLDLKA